MKNCVVLEDTDEHDISCNWKNNPLQDITNVNAEKIKAIDFLDVMKERTEELAFKFLNLRPTEIR